MSDQEVEWLRQQWENNKAADLTIGTIVTTSKKQQQPRKSCEVAAEWMKRTAAAAAIKSTT